MKTAQQRAIQKVLRKTWRKALRNALAIAGMVSSLGGSGLARAAATPAAGVVDPHSVAAPHDESQELSADPNAHTGIGLILGVPLGLSAEIELSPIRAIDMAVAGYVDTGRSFHVHADYLLKALNAFPYTTLPIDFYFGVGGRYLLYNSCCRAGSDLNRVGVRLPIGLSAYLPRQHIQTFAEVAFIVDVITTFGFDLDYAVGGRYFF